MTDNHKLERNSRHEQAAETREKLLATAKNLFALKGYHGTPVRAINRELGMADGLLYHYFPGGKREMLTVLFKESFEKRAMMMGETNSLMESLPLEEALNLMSKRIYGLFLADMDIMRILFREHDVLDIAGTEMLSNFIMERSRWFVGLLETRHLQGEIRKMDFEFAAKQFMAMNILFIVSAIIGINLNGGGDPDTYRERVVQYTMDLWKNP